MFDNNEDLYDYIKKINKKNINNVFNNNKTILYYAVMFNNIKIVKILLNYKNINVNIAEYRYNETPLILATRKKNIEIVKLLLENKNIDINAKNIFNQTALNIASFFNDIEIVKILLDHKKINIEE